MPEKAKIAIYWASGSCGGCDVSVLDVDEKILDITEEADFLFWPAALDFKYSDVRGLEDGEIDICFINGAGLRTSEDEEIIELLRKKSDKIVALGSCSCFGGISGMGNEKGKEDVFAEKYEKAPSLVDSQGIYPETVTQVPEGELTLPEYNENVRALDQFIDVDYYLPGCPTEPDLVVEAIDAALSANPPESDHIFAEEKNLCHQCKYDPPEEKLVKEFRRVHNTEIEDECFLKQGIICVGPATRGGCEARCIEGGFPCRGCFGPAPDVDDQGAKMVSLLGSILDSEDRGEIQRIVDDISDPLGTFYSYGLPTSILGKSRRSKWKR